MQIFHNLTFLAKLLAKQVASLWRMVFMFLAFYGGFLTVLCLIVVVTFSRISNLKTDSLATQESQLNNDQAAKKSNDQLDYWLSALKKQPTSRDALWNISLIYQSKNDLSSAEEYKTKALLVDPNFQFPVNLK